MKRKRGKVAYVGVEGERRKRRERKKGKGHGKEGKAISEEQLG